MVEQVLSCGHVKDGRVGYVMLGATDETICAPCHTARKRAAYAPKVLRRERVDLRKHIGFATTVGIVLIGKDRNFPRSHGNCCDVLNMNAENIDEALRRWPGLGNDCEVEVVEWQGREHVRVVDSRLTGDWLRHVCDGCGVYESAGG